MGWSTIRDKDIKVWDKIKVQTTKPDKDPRPESRKIDNKTVVNCGCAIKEREERREFLNSYMDKFLPDATKTRRTLSIIKPILFGFSVEKEDEQSEQVTLSGDTFKVHPYGGILLNYQFKCGEKGCEMCSQVHKFHNMQCFDFGANELYKRYNDEKIVCVATLLGRNCLFVINSCLPKRGYGTKMMDYAEKKALEDNCSTMEVRDIKDEKYVKDFFIKRNYVLKPHPEIPEKTCSF
jgi:hypothetical protein